MNVTTTKNEFQEIIMTFFIVMAEEQGKMISEGTLVHTPLFDSFLAFLKSKSLPSKLKLAYTQLDGSTKTKYKRLQRQLEGVNGDTKVIITI